jgi:ribonuclease G
VAPADPAAARQGSPVNLKMLVETDPHETRIAVLEDDRLTEIYIERDHHRGLVGNVYKGRVTRVLPGMQAAFVDIGLDRDTFLYVSDVEANERVGEEEEEAFLDEESPFERPRAPAASHPPIEDLLRPGQELIVQVVKDPLPNKGARISTHVTLPGRYLVLLPTVHHFGVSRRIEDPEERARLLELLQGSAPNDCGLIVRTVGEGRQREDFEADLSYLPRLWQRIKDRAAAVAAPTLLHQDLDLALRVVRDLFHREFSVLWVEGEETYERIVEFLDQVHPTLVGKVRLYRQTPRLFERFGIESQIDAALRSKVWLKSGGYIVINPTEALVAIDVNTGRFVGQRNLEETVLQTNLEAVTEIVRQIRLRDLGGIIVIDLIDMVEEEHRRQVSAKLEAELKKDRARTRVLSISAFGLVEITRKRSRNNIERLLTRPCPYCDGRGRIKAVATLCLELRRHLLGSGGPALHRELLLRVHPEVARALQQEERAVLDELERSLGTSILLQSDPSLHHERFDIVEV